MPWDPKRLARFVVQHDNVQMAGPARASAKAFEHAHLVLQVEMVGGFVQQAQRRVLGSEQRGVSARRRSPPAGQRRERTRGEVRSDDQLGTMGAGNHFVEVDAVEEIFNEKEAEKFGLFQGAGGCFNPHRFPRPGASNCH